MSTTQLHTIFFLKIVSKSNSNYVLVFQGHNCSTDSYTYGQWLTLTSVGLFLCNDSAKFHVLKCGDPPMTRQNSSSHLIFYSLKTVVKRNCVQVNTHIHIYIQ